MFAFSSPFSGDLMAPPLRTRAIGIDPGSVHCGWGIVDRDGSRLVHVASGTIDAGRGAFDERLERIYRVIVEVCEQHGPDEAAIEALFYQKNAQSALKLGHARGVAILALRHRGLTVAEYEPTLVKKSVTGRGAADKVQVQAMIGVLLNYRDAARLDETDALAVAVCHLQHNPLLQRAFR